QRPRPGTRLEGRRPRRRAPGPARSSPPLAPRSCGHRPSGHTVPRGRYLLGQREEWCLAIARGMTLEGLNRYDRATVALWSRSHAELARRSGQTCLAEAAVHAVLAGLRRCAEPGTLLARYEAEAAADFALIGSLVAGKSSD